MWQWVDAVAWQTRQVTKKLPVLSGTKKLPVLSGNYWLIHNPFPNKPWFLHVCITSHLKTLCLHHAHHEQFLLFPQCFLSFLKTFHHFYQIWNCRLQTLSVWKSLNFVVWQRAKTLSWFCPITNLKQVTLTLSQTSPGFYVYAVQGFWKYCGKRRNCS